MPYLTKPQADLMLEALEEIANRSLFPEHAARFRELRADLGAVVAAMRPQDTLKVTKTRTRKGKEDEICENPHFPRL